MQGNDVLGVLGGDSTADAVFAGGEGGGAVVGLGGAVDGLDSLLGDQEPKGHVRSQATTCLFRLQHLLQPDRRY